MFHNRRRDGDIWQRAMDRENAVAWAAIVSGAMSPDPLDPLPEDEDDLGFPPCPGCGQGWCECHLDPEEEALVCEPEPRSGGWGCTCTDRTCRVCDPVENDRWTE